MNILRSLLFNILFFAGSLFWSIALLWTLVLPEKKCTRIISAVYGGYIAFIERYAMGLTLKIKGWEHVPKHGPYILAAKHQSAFETLNLPYMKKLGYPAIVLKKELTYIPFWGWYPARMGGIAVDRGAGIAAMNSLVRGCKRVLSSGRPVLIFPQGTRTAVGSHAAYKAGIAKIYKETQVPVVPLALNSGLFWGRNSFFKKSGVITFEFLPVIPAGLPPLKMMARLEKEIETATDRLVAEAHLK